MRRGRYFVSLKWKSLLNFFVLLALLLGAMIAVTTGWFETHQDELKAQRLEQQAEGVRYVSDNNSQRLLSYVDTFFVFSDPNIAPWMRNNVQSAFSTYWEINELEWALENAWLVTRHGRVVGEWGSNLTFNWWDGVKEVLHTLAPVSEIRCQEICLQYLAVPFPGEHLENMVLVLTTSLLQHVVTLKKIHHVDIGILYPDEQGGLGRWPVKLASMTQAENREQLMAAVEHVADTVPLSHLIANHVEVSFDEQNYVVWLHRLGRSDRPGYFLFIDNITAQTKHFNRYLQQSAVVSLLILLLGLACTYLLLSAQISRLRRQVEILPMLAKQQFGKARKRLIPGREVFADELSLLEHASVSLADKLSLLTRDVQTRTAELERMAMYDELTGLPNRNLLLQFLSQSLASLGRDRELLAVVLIDLDDFQRVNDLLEHQGGDDLLVVTGRRLKAALRGADMVGRFGADTFVAILPVLDSKDQIYRVLTTLMDEIRQPVQLQNQAFVVTACMGVAFSTTGEAFSAEELVKQADTAMHEAKSLGSNRFCFFDARMSETIAKRIELERDLREATEQSQFCLHLQPQVELQDGRLTGFEALIRWQHPEKGLLFPNAFIDELERSEHIIQVGYWTIQHGLELLAQICLKVDYPLKLAVNLTPHQFLEPGLSRVIESELENCCLSPSQLELELTEGTLIGDVDAVTEQMARLGELGVKIAIDDFGTGYSSLSYLRRLPVDILKIDRAFVASVPDDERDAMLICSILSMAEQMRLEVVAEGVETLAQADYLKQQGCRFGQGFGIARPIDEARLLEVVQNRTTDGIWRFEAHDD